jgi:hypothetical protein
VSKAQGSGFDGPSSAVKCLVGANLVSLKTAATVVVIALSLPPIAPATTITMFGGEWTCGVWLTARANHQSQFLEGWVAGYLSGVNVGYGAVGFRDALATTDALSAYIWVDTWCRAHPLDNVLKAANSLAEEVSKRAGKVDTKK